jgi:hypothetical protein
MDSTPSVASATTSKRPPRLRGGTQEEADVVRVVGDQDQDRLR